MYDTTDPPILKSILISTPFRAMSALVPDEADFHCLIPDVTFPVKSLPKTAQSILKKVLDAAGGKIFQQARQLTDNSPDKLLLADGVKSQLVNGAESPLIRGTAVGSALSTPGR
jgi:hypothetical protein